MHDRWKAGTGGIVRQRTKLATKENISKLVNISKLGNKVRREGNSSDISEINILNVLKPIGPITYKQYIEEGPRTFTELLMRKREVRWSPGKGEKEKVKRVENRERKKIVWELQETRV